MEQKHKIFLTIGLIITIFSIWKYQNEILIFLLPIVILIKNKFYLFISTIIGKSIYFFSISKTKLIIYLKTLTLYKTIILTGKRFIIDNYFSKWVNNNFVEPIKEPLINYLKFFLKLGLKNKIKRILYFILPLGIIVFIAQLTGILENILLLAELKAIVIGFFKLLWIFIAKIGIYFSTFILTILKNTWLVSIIEIFALSWLIGKVEKIPFIGKYIIKFFSYIFNLFDIITETITKLYNKYIYGHISLKFKDKMENIGNKLHDFLENTKHDNELFILNHFKLNYVTNKRFKEYYKDVNFSKIYNKNEIYRLINKKTKDNVDIKYYFNVNVNNIEEDILIIESVASCNISGNNKGKITKNSFWVLNLSNETIEIKSKNEKNFLNRTLKSGKLKLIHTSQKHDFDNIIVIYKNEILNVNKVELN
jgi:hypothetical protein